MAGQETPPGGGEDELREESRRNPTLSAARERRRKERHRAVALLPEVRYFKPGDLEVRALADTNEITVSGAPIQYAVSYRVVDPWGEFEERIHAGSATELLARGVDCRLLLNHDGLPMARTTAGTMDLWDTDAALRFKAGLDARQQLANDFAIAIERQDITQMSVGMIVGQDEWGEEDGMETRDIFALNDLLDVSGVTYPASPSTSIEVAHRMAMRVPVESRARLRQFYLDGRAGKTLAPERFEALRSMLDADADADIDPGDDTQTPDGTGRLGHPDGNGQTWADPGLPSSTPPDGTEGGTGDYAQQAPDDGIGSRSDDTPKTSRATALRVKRALRGI